MKGAYLTIIDTNNNFALGVIKKIRNQKRAFEQLGCTMTLYHPKKQTICKDDAVLYESKVPIFYDLQKNALLYRYAQEDIIKEKYNFLYIRYPLATPYFVKFLHKIKQKLPEITLIVEIATFPYANEGKTTKLKLLFKIDSMFTQYLKKYVDRIVTFYGQDEIYGIKTLRFGNGIDTDSTPVVPHVPIATKRQINIVAIANLKYYHAYDRILSGMAKNNTGFSVIFNIVGGGPELNNLIELTNQMGIHEYVRFHGFKQGEELDRIVAQSDIGIGTLGMHRKNLQTDSSLKTREYCAKGLPFIVSCPDPDFDNEFIYQLRIPHDDSPLDIQSLVDFYLKIKAIPDYQSKMHQYAIDHLDWKVKIRKVLNYVEHKNDFVDR